MEGTAFGSAKRDFNCRRAAFAEPNALPSDKLASGNHAPVQDRAIRLLLPLQSKGTLRRDRRLSPARRERPSVAQVLLRAICNVPNKNDDCVDPSAIAAFAAHVGKCPEDQLARPQRPE